MRIISIIILLMTLISCEKERQDEVILNRIEYVYNLKSVLNEDVWPDFSNKRNDLPLVYYTDSSCYVSNPTQKYIDIYKPILAYESGDLRIYRSFLIDSVPFHMSAGLSYEDSTKYNYKSSFMNCSSLEITQNFVPDVFSVEQWATMVIHEYFHGFQFKHHNFLTYCEQFVFEIPRDSLKNLYKDYLWFKKSVDKENDLLLSAIKSESDLESLSLVKSFFAIRDKRRKKLKGLLTYDLKNFEEGLETLEGTARYIEYSLYGKLATEQAYSKLLKSDTLYRSNTYFKDYNIVRDSWLYLTSNTSYFYAIGFNMARLLDKLQLDYKSRLFVEKGLTLESVLREQLDK